MEILLSSEKAPKADFTVNADQTHIKIFTPGETICQDSNYMRGHGTYTQDEKLISSTAGYLTRVNKLLTVTPLRQVYQGAIGDTIVGRITQVQNTRWKVDINSRLDAELRLANIQLPGGEQRRKDLDDERGMRGLLKEGDLVCIEVQKISEEGVVRLAARSLKFGKLSQGTLLKVSPSLIVQDKQRIHDMPFGVRVIFAANGYIFITPNVAQELVYSYVDNFDEVPFEVREVIARVSNAITIMADKSIMISPNNVIKCYEISLELNYEAKELLKADPTLDIAKSLLEALSE